MLIDFKEQEVEGYIVPGFTLSSGEIVVIKLPDGQIFFDMTTALNAILTKENNDTVVPFRYTTHFNTIGIFKNFFPMSVGKWLDKNANKSNWVYKDIYKEIEWLTPKIKINSLGGSYRRLLSLYTALSWTNNIILDLVGVDPEGAIRIYALLKKIAADGGAVILYDQCDEFKNDCTLFVKTRPIEIRPVNS